MTNVQSLTSLSVFMLQLSLLLAKNFPHSGDCVQKGEYCACQTGRGLSYSWLGESSGKGLVYSRLHSESYGTLSWECEKEQGHCTERDITHGPAQKSSHCVNQASLELTQIQAWATLSPARES